LVQSKLHIKEWFKTDESGSIWSHKSNDNIISDPIFSLDPSNVVNILYPVEMAEVKEWSKKLWLLVKLMEENVGTKAVETSYVRQKLSCFTA
jgi:hypothetical protein